MLLATMLMPSPGNAQALSERAYLGPHPSPLFNTGPDPSDKWAVPQALEPAQFKAAVDAKSRSSYWLEGAIAGGVLLGAATALFAYGLCKDPDSYTGGGNCVLIALAGAVPAAMVGGVIGAFVGKTIPKGGKAAAR